MKKLICKIVALPICVVLLISTFFVCSSAYPTKTDISSYSVGDKILFGTYPQSDVTAEMGSILNSISGTWKSYNYYSGTNTLDDGKMTPSDFMRYKDVSYGGNKYRAVTFDYYRPFYTALSLDNPKNEKRSNGYKPGKIYWFRYDPIVWRVLDPSSGLLMSDIVIDSQAFNSYSLKSGHDARGNDAYWGNSEKTYYQSNYKESDIRKWLNNNFYNTAFSNDQKANILLTSLNNKSYHSYSDYNVSSTNDSVFLLSVDEVSFISGYNTMEGTSFYRLAASDYAKSQGIGIMENSSSLEYNGKVTTWWLRTAQDSQYVLEGTYKGNFFRGEANVCSAGICPAIKVKSIYSSGPIYKLTYNENGDNVSIFPQSMSGYGSIEISNIKPIRSNYDFLGWSTNKNDSTPTYKPGDKISLINDIDLYAIWRDSSISTELSQLSSVVINAPFGNKTINWKYRARLVASAYNLPSKYHLAWFEGKDIVCNNADFTTDRLTSLKTYTVKIVDENGNAFSTPSQEKTVTINVKTDFLAKLVYFFNSLFGSTVTKY